MPANLCHFAINADDVTAARTFYEAVFAWKFTPWGPPGFFHIDTGGGETQVRGALQERRQLLDGPTRSPECSFAVDDVDATGRRVVEAGGRIVMDRFTIAGVGHLIGFEDPSGNLMLAMQYDGDAT
jgi:predicted enzyme related to lactoylglutathione lyase